MLEKNALLTGIREEGAEVVNGVAAEDMDHEFFLARLTIGDVIGLIKF